MIAAVIFDCDGVLFDSWRANVAYYNAILARMGQPRLDGVWEERAHVMALAQLFDEMFADEPALRERAQRTARELDYAPYYALMQPVADLYPVLAHLKRSHRLAMATNRGATLPGVVRHFALDRYLEFAVGVLDVARPKPHPDMLEKCVAHFGVSPTAAVYVGDAESDRQAAAAAGTHFIGVGAPPWTSCCVPELRAVPDVLRAWPER